jgi:hypothetical protein
VGERLPLVLVLVMDVSSLMTVLSLPSRRCQMRARHCHVTPNVPSRWMLLHSIGDEMSSFPLLSRRSLTITFCVCVCVYVSRVFLLIFEDQYSTVWQIPFSLYVWRERKPSRCRQQTLKKKKRSISNSGEKRESHWRFFFPPFCSYSNNDIQKKKKNSYGEEYRAATYA